jgi:hypothetical protein
MLQGAFMSDEKPTYKELSAFGQCVADTHIKKALDSSAKSTAPAANASPEEKKQHAEFSAIIASRSEAARDIVLDTIGIDRLVVSSELVNSCSSKLPNPKPLDLKKAARTTRG